MEISLLSITILRITKSEHSPQSDHWHRWSLPTVGLTPKRAWRSKFLSRARKEFDVCFMKVFVWKMITWTPHLEYIPNLAGDKSLLVKVVLNIASFESSEKIFQSLRFPRRIKLGYLETVKICVEVFPWCDVGRYSHRYFFVVQTLRS